MANKSGLLEAEFSLFSPVLFCFLLIFLDFLDFLLFCLLNLYLLRFCSLLSYCDTLFSIAFHFFHVFSSIIFRFFLFLSSDFFGFLLILLVFSVPSVSICSFWIFPFFLLFFVLFYFDYFYFPLFQDVWFKIVQFTETIFFNLKSINWQKKTLFSFYWIDVEYFWYSNLNWFFFRFHKQKRRRTHSGNWVWPENPQQKRIQWICF